MTHTYSNMLVHLVWSTKNRNPYIQPDIKHRLYAYIRKLVEKEGAHVIIMNGMPDHIHVLLRYKPSLFITDLICKIKTTSSKWISKTFSNLDDFAWQEGYGIFTVGHSNKESVIKYIENQEKHHQSHTFESEFKQFLDIQKIDYDKRFVMG